MPGKKKGNEVNVELVKRETQGKVEKTTTGLPADQIPQPQDE